MTKAYPGMFRVIHVYTGKAHDDIVTHTELLTYAELNYYLQHKLPVATTLSFQFIFIPPHSEDVDETTRA